jgi:hypothetical protein
MLWLELPPSSSSSSPSGSPPAAGMPYGGAGSSLVEAQGRVASQTPPPAEAGEKCPAAPAPHAGGVAVFLGG